MILHITIPGIPIPQKRHRHTSRGKFVRVYDPQAKEKKRIAAVLIEQVGQILTENHLESPISITLHFFLPIPKSTSKKLRKRIEAYEIEHTKKPDLDNLQKFLLDAANGILWKDDAQIYCIDAHKHYSDNPQTEIYIRYANTSESPNSSKPMSKYKKNITAVTPLPKDLKEQLEKDYADYMGIKQVT